MRRIPHMTKAHFKRNLVLYAVLFLALMTALALKQSSDNSASAVSEKLTRNQVEAVKREALVSYAACIRGNITREVNRESLDNLATLFSNLSKVVSSPGVSILLQDAVPVWRTASRDLTDVPCERLLFPDQEPLTREAIISGAYLDIIDPSLHP